jgi:WD40 repeat protein
MADGDSLGADTQKRAWAFIYALFMAHENREGNPDDGEIRIVRENWSDQRKNGYPTLIVSANKKELLEVIRKQKTILGNLKFSSEHFSSAYNVWLAQGKPLNILKDLRKIKRGSKANLYQFKLALWSTVLEDNELEFKRAWEEGKQHKNSEYISSSDNSSSDKCPYKGLFAFDKEDVSFFFGRKKIIRTLVNAVQKQPLVAVVGNSGIGKSSVIRAGLIPELESSEAWKIAILRPTNNPFFRLAKALLELFEPKMDALGREINAKKYANDFKNGDLILKDILESQLQEISTKQRILIVVDQFEELYTLCSEDERNIFLDQLLGAIEIENENPKLDVVLVITLRADFYTYAISHPALGKALQVWKTETLLKMNPDELKEAIEEPAQIAKLKIQDGLTQIILEAVKNNQGELPLLEFTLEKLWEKRSNGQLTISAYHEIGGVQQALANHAETVYNQLNEKEKKQAQHIFTQLVCFGENTDDTRRLASLDEIGSENWGLVTKLTGVERDLKARLVITGKDSKEQPTVEVVHEALIRGWERLREWMEEYREFRKWQDRLRSEKDIWENSGRDNGALLRGALLVEAEKWLKEKSDSTTSQQEIEFILACRQHQEEQEIERIKELLTLSQKELQLKQQLMSLFFAIKAAVKFRNIQEPSDDLKKNILNRLQQASYGISEQNQFVGHSEGIVGVAFSQDGSMLASANNDRTVKLWNLDGQLLKTFEGHTGQVYEVSFSPDGQIIASVGTDKTVRLWRVEDGTHLRTLEGHTDDTRGVSFSSDGQIIASTSADRTVRLWRVEDGIHLRTLEGHTDWVWGVSFSPDGQIIATASIDTTVRFWRVEDGTHLRTLEGHTDGIRRINFSPDGQIIATASADRTVRLWRVENGTHLRTLEGHTDEVWGVSFSPDGQIIATVSADRTVRLWRVENGTLLKTLEGHTDRIWGVSFSPDGQIIASTSADRTVRLWKFDDTLLRTLEGHTSHIRQVSFSHNGQMIASASDDRTIKLGCGSCHNMKIGNQTTIVSDGGIVEQRA